VPKRTSRLPGFYRLTPDARLAHLVEAGLLTEDEASLLRGSGGPGLPLEVADHLVENLVGVLPVPVGLGTNLVVNERDYVVPLATEEPSVVAAISSASRLVREAGGFSAASREPLMLGQLHQADPPDPEGARRALLAHREELLAAANALCERMVRRGGGARDLEVRMLGVPTGNGGHTLLVVHLLIDTRDAMGANTINAVLEGLAPRVEELARGGVYLRILSNLPDRCLARATCRIPAEALAVPGYAGEEVGRRIELASRAAEQDPYRAATQNKGIMNGVDAVAAATGNDWRALEAGAHAYAARGGRYGTLALWRFSDGHLDGALELPLAVGTAGGPAEGHPTVAVFRRLLGVDSARELREVMVAVGLAVNLGALRALATDGIRKGQMGLYARAVAVSGGAPPRLVDEVARRLVESGEVKPWKAREILAELEGA